MLNTCMFKLCKSWAVLYEPRYEKTGFLHMRKQRRRSASRCGNRKADQRLCFRYTESTIPLLSKSEISSLLSHILWPYSPVCVGPGRKPRRPVFSEQGSYELHHDKNLPFAYTERRRSAGADRTAEPLFLLHR